MTRPATTTSPSFLRRATALVRYASDSIDDMLAMLGQMVLNGLQAFKFIAKGRIHAKHVVEQVAMIGFDSLPMVVIISMIAGSVLSIQTAKRFAETGADNYVGAMVALSMVREIAPIFACLTVGARAGTAIAAEIANMRVTKQVDALQIMHVSPVRYLIVPRLIACVICLPMLTVVAEFIAILGGMVMARVAANLHPQMFIESVWLRLSRQDIYDSLIKAVVFGVILAIICTTIGLMTRGGARQVGLSTTKATIWTSVAIVIADFILSWLFYAGERVL